MPVSKDLRWDKQIIQILALVRQVSRERGREWWHYQGWNRSRTNRHPRSAGAVGEEADTNHQRYSSRWIDCQGADASWPRWSSLQVVSLVRATGFTGNSPWQHSDTSMDELYLTTFFLSVFFSLMRLYLYVCHRCKFRNTTKGGGLLYFVELDHTTWETGTAWCGKLQPYVEDK
jgi:hypothetical protein